MVEKRGLGRGLSALMADIDVAAPSRTDSAVGGGERIIPIEAGPKSPEP